MENFTCRIFFLNVSNLSSYRRGIWILLPINTPKLLLVFTLINTQKKTSKKQNQKSRINSSPLRVKVYIWSRGLRRHWVQRGHGIGGKTSDRFNDSVCPRRRIRMLPLMISVSMVYFFRVEYVYRITLFVSLLWCWCLLCKMFTG